MQTLQHCQRCGWTKAVAAGPTVQVWLVDLRLQGTRKAYIAVLGAAAAASFARHGWLSGIVATVIAALATCTTDSDTPAQYHVQRHT